MCNNVEGSTETFSVSAAPITLTLSANPTSVYPARTSGNNVAVITATVSDQFGPFPEYAVAFEQPTFDPYFQTGHSHQNTLPDPLKGSYSSFSCVTTADGSCNIAFIASEVSGQAEIVAKSSLGPTQSNSLNIVVWVPELIQFFVRPFPVDEDHWYLPPPSNSQHTGTRAIRGSERDRIFAVGSYYLQNGGSGVLVMGDASLPRGGLFDVNGNWSTPYPDHREGLEIDIGLKTCGTDNSAACSGAPHFDVDEDNLNDALDSWIWGSYVPGEEIGEGPGFHVRFRP